MAHFRMNLLSNILGFQVSVTVILPSYRNEDKDYRNVYIKDKKYPVLWLLHGGGGDDQDWITYTSVCRYAEEREMAVIMPSAQNSFYTDTEYGIRYWSFIVNELYDCINSMFPISDKREDNYLAGLSMGGHGAFKYAMNYPERFSKVICMSGLPFTLEELQSMSTEYKDIERNYGFIANKKQTEDDVYFLMNDNKEKLIDMPQFYFACGEEDSLFGVVLRGKKWMEALGYQVQWYTIPGLSHEWKFWDLCIEKAFKEWL